MLLIMGGPIFGKIYKFYYIIPFWDKSLHVSSGFLFAVIGAVLPDVLDSGNKSHSQALKLVSALSFTLAIAAVWEFYEYAMDTFFGMDMQQDTIVSGINSYLLGSEKGVAGSVSDIQSVIVNGEELSINDGRFQGEVGTSGSSWRAGLHVFALVSHKNYLRRIRSVLRSANGRILHR